MKCRQTWKRLKPDTINGHSIEVITVYHSMDADEIEKMAKICKETIGIGRSFEFQIDEKGEKQ